MSTPKTSYTAEDLMGISSQGKRFELVKGELIEMPPTGGRHGRVASRIDYRLRGYVEERALGEVFAAETGFRLVRNPDTVRAPDVAFVSKERLPSEEQLIGFPDLVPDLVVEVVSPSDSAAQVQAKVEDWLRSGVRLVWVAYPDTRSVAVYRALDEIAVVGPGDVLEGGPVLRGFSCPVSDIF
jgi:Uma2 family endonuclease